MKYYIILLSILLIGLAGATLNACSDNNEIDVADVPCVGLTQVLDCSGNISVINLNTSIQTNITTNAIGGGIYNFTFNFTEDSYELIDCMNNTATVIVGDFPRDDLWKIAILLGIIGIAIIFIISSIIIFDNSAWMLKALLIVAGALCVVLGINVSLSFTLIPNLRTLVGVSSIISIVFISIFVLYLLIYYMVYLFRGLKSSRKYEEE